MVYFVLVVNIFVSIQGCPDTSDKVLGHTYCTVCGAKSPTNITLNYVNLTDYACDSIFFDPQDIVYTNDGEFGYFYDYSFQAIFRINLHKNTVRLIVGQVPSYLSCLLSNNPGKGLGFCLAQAR